MGLFYWPGIRNWPGLVGSCGDSGAGGAVERVGIGSGARA